MSTSTTIPADSAPLGPTPPRLVDPGLAARVPGLRRGAAVALVLGVATAVVVVVQAIALATAVERSLLHHAPLHDVLVYVVVVGIALLVRAALTGAGDLFAHGTAARVVTDLRRELLTHALTLGPGWLAGERPGELSLTATRGCAPSTRIWRATSRRQPPRRSSPSCCWPGWPLRTGCPWLSSWLSSRPCPSR